MKGRKKTQRIEKMSRREIPTFHFSHINDITLGIPLKVLLNAVNSTYRAPASRNYIEHRINLISSSWQTVHRNMVTTSFCIKLLARYKCSKMPCFQSRVSWTIIDIKERNHHLTTTLKLQC